MRYCNETDPRRLAAFIRRVKTRAHLMMLLHEAYSEEAEGKESVPDFASAEMADTVETLKDTMLEIIRDDEMRQERFIVPETDYYSRYFIPAVKDICGLLETADTSDPDSMDTVFINIYMYCGDNGVPDTFGGISCESSVDYTERRVDDILRRACRYYSEAHPDFPLSPEIAAQKAKLEIARKLVAYSSGTGTGTEKTAEKEELVNTVNTLLRTPYMQIHS